MLINIKFREASILFSLREIIKMESPKRNILLENYAKAYDQIIDAIKEFPKEMWHYKPAPDKWSIQEIMIHIADSEVNSYARCRKIISEPGTRIYTYDQDKWSEKLKYNETNHEDALALFKYLRKLTVNLVKELPEEFWELSVDHDEYGAYTLERWLEIYEPHIPNHINQMKKVYEIWKSNIK